MGEEVQSKDFFGKTRSEKGYLWRGNITIHMKKLPKGMTIRNLYDDEGEDYFDGEAAIQKKKEKEQEQETKGAVNESENADGAVEENQNENEETNEKEKEKEKV